jgi:polysaccharide biosynthesis protein PslH
LKILFVANRFPFPPFRGDKLKIYNLSKRLSGKHKLVLATFTQDKLDLENKDKLDSIFSQKYLVHLPKWKSILQILFNFWTGIPFQVAYFKSNKFKNELGKIIEKEKPDVVHVQHIRMAQYLKYLKNTPAILDLPDAFSLYWKRRIEKEKNILVKWFNKIEYQRLLKYEKVLNDYNMSLVCSEEDRDYLRNEQNIQNLNLLHNGVDLNTFTTSIHDYSHNHTILFTGNMNYAPNVDAVIFFCEKILPKVRLEFPTVNFIIAGQKPVKKVLDLESDFIEVTGFVEDISVYYNKASVVVAPLRFGAGTQNKVLEALAMGVPVVCSNIGFNGLGIQNGEGAFMEIEEDGFSNKVIELLNSHELRKKTGEKGKDIIRNKFDWNVLALKLEKYFEEINNG